MDIYKKIIYALIPMIIIAVLIEGGLRLFPWHKDVVFTRAGLVVADKDLIWKLAPQSAGELKTNELGLRDTPYNSKADKKILLLGDSVSWGDSMENVESVYPYILEQFFSEKSQKAYEIINSAVLGYSTFQQYRYLELYGLQLKPDLILLQFCLNDVVERYTNLSEYGGNNVFLGIDTRHAIHGLHGWLLRNSRIYEAIMRVSQSAARTEQSYRVEELAKDLPSPEIKEAWKQTLSEIESIRKLAAENKIPFIIVVFPYRFQLVNPDKYNQPQLQMLKYAKEKKVSIIDLLPLFAEYQQRNPGVEIFFDDNHLTVGGHQLTAEILAQNFRIHDGILP